MSKIAIFLTTLLSLACFSVVTATDPVIVQQKVVEFDSRYFRGEDHYHRLGEQLVNEKNQDRNDRINKLESQLELLLKLLIAQNGGNGNVPGTPALPPQEEVPVVRELDKQVLDLFNRKCLNCHGKVPQNNGLSLIVDNKLANLDVYERSEVYDRVQGHKLEERGKAIMPKGGTLTDDEVSLVYIWKMEKDDAERASRGK